MEPDIDAGDTTAAHPPSASATPHTIDETIHTTTAKGGAVATSYVMKVSSNGQVSIPADARARWGADRMVVVDLGDRLVMRPLPDDPVGAVIGKYKRGPTTSEARRRAREEDARPARRRAR